MSLRRLFASLDDRPRPTPAEFAKARLLEVIERDRTRRWSTEGVWRKTFRWNLIGAQFDKRPHYRWRFR